MNFMKALASSGSIDTPNILLHKAKTGTSKLNLTDNDLIMTIFSFLSEKELVAGCSLVNHKFHLLSLSVLADVRPRGLFQKVLLDFPATISREKFKETFQHSGMIEITSPHSNKRLIEIAEKKSKIENEMNLRWNRLVGEEPIKYPKEATLKDKEKIQNQCIEYYNHSFSKKMFAQKNSINLASNECKHDIIKNLTAQDDYELPCQLIKTLSWSSTTNQEELKEARDLSILITKGLIGEGPELDQAEAFAFSLFGTAVGPDKALGVLADLEIRNALSLPTALAVEPLRHAEYLIAEMNDSGQKDQAILDLAQGWQNSGYAERSQKIRQGALEKKLEIKEIVPEIVSSGKKRGCIIS